MYNVKMSQYGYLLKHEVYQSFDIALNKARQLTVNNPTTFVEIINENKVDVDCPMGLTDIESDAYWETVGLD